MTTCRAMPPFLSSTPRPTHRRADDERDRPHLNDSAVNRVCQPDKGRNSSRSTPQQPRRMHLQRHHVDASQLRRGSDLIQLEEMLRARSHALRPALEPDGVVPIVLLDQAGRQRDLAVKRHPNLVPDFEFLNGPVFVVQWCYFRHTNGFSHRLSCNERLRSWWRLLPGERGACLPGIRLNRQRR